MEGLLGALSVARGETIGHREREQAGVAALTTLRTEVHRDALRPAQVAGALAAVRRERDEAKALASDGATAVHRLVVALAAERSQRLREERDGTAATLLLSVYPFLLFFAYRPGRVFEQDWWDTLPRVR